MVILKGFSSTSIKAELDPTVGQSPILFEKMRYWATGVERYRTNCRIQLQLSQLNSLKTRELLHTVGISERPVHRILIEKLTTIHFVKTSFDMKNLYSQLNNGRAAKIIRLTVF